MACFSSCSWSLKSVGKEVRREDFLIYIHKEGMRKHEELEELHGWVRQSSSAEFIYEALHVIWQIAAISS